MDMIKLYKVHIVLFAVCACSGVVSFESFYSDYPCAN